MKKTLHFKFYSKKIADSNNEQWRRDKLIYSIDNSLKNSIKEQNVKIIETKYPNPLCINIYPPRHFDLFRDPTCSIL